MDACADLAHAASSSTTSTGLGERDHLLETDIDLDCTTSINLLEYEDLQRAILVGHGYGGAVAQRGAALAPSVRRLLFLGALLAAPAPASPPPSAPPLNPLKTLAPATTASSTPNGDTGLLRRQLASATPAGSRTTSCRYITPSTKRSTSPPSTPSTAPSSSSATLVEPRQPRLPTTSRRPSFPARNRRRPPRRDLGRRHRRTDRQLRPPTCMPMAWTAGSTIAEQPTTP
ncbi:MAG: hypothetical protein U0232_11645 [Thermomicrobiales bacterium]